MARRWVVAPEQARQRLDLFLAAAASLSRSAAQRGIVAGAALLNGKSSKPGQLLAPGDEIVFTELKPVAASLKPEAIPLSVVYEDADLLVIDKPRGLVVHPAAGNLHGTLVNALLAHCDDLSGIGGVIRPGIVHRLDKDTTGLLVVAKNDAAHLNLAAQLKERTMSRTYLALVHGVLPASQGSVEMPIGRHPVDRKRMAVSARGREAVTHYRVLEELDRLSLLQLKLATGRTHQIRVHLASIGHPVVGDRTYGRHHERTSLPGQALHAARLEFAHPRHGTKMVFTTPPPADFLAELARARAAIGRDPAAPIDF